MSDPHTPADRGSVVDLLVAAVFVALIVLLGAAVVRGMDGVAALAVVSVAALLGVAAADLSCGVVHWFCDTFFAEDTPVLGPLLIQPFREHHDDPAAMTRRSFLSTNRTNVIVMTALLALMAAARTRGTGWSTLFVDAWLLTFALAAGLTNELHKLAHGARVPAAVRWLQARHLVISPAHHARHHDTVHGGHFCVTTGWLNPVLDLVVGRRRAGARRA